MLAVDGCCYSV